MTRARSDKLPWIFSLLRSPTAMMQMPNAMRIPPRMVGKKPGPMRSALPNR